MNHMNKYAAPYQRGRERISQDLLECCLRVQGNMINDFYASQVKAKLRGKDKEYILGFLAGLTIGIKRVEAIDIMVAEVTSAYSLLFDPDY